MLWVLAYFFFFDVEAVGATSPLTSGRVKDTPSSPAEAPRICVSLALGPRVTVLEHPNVSSAVAAVSVTSVFMFG